MMRLRRSPKHFPYAKYSQCNTCACWRCRVRHRARAALQSHDFWCWLYAAIVLCTLIVLEVMRNAR